MGIPAAFIPSGQKSKKAISQVRETIAGTLGAAK